MFFLSVEQAPKFSQDAESTMAFARSNPKSLLLVIEGHRDFLSAPRKFIVLQAKTHNSIQISSDGLFLTDEQWHTLNKMEYGLYKVEQSQMELSENEYHWLCYTHKCLLEFSAIKVDVRETLYHQKDVFDALHHFISTNSF